MLKHGLNTSNHGIFKTTLSGGNTPVQTPVVEAISHPPDPLTPPSMAMSVSDPSHHSNGSWTRVLHNQSLETDQALNDRLSSSTGIDTQVLSPTSPGQLTPTIFANNDRHWEVVVRPGNVIDVVWGVAGDASHAAAAVGSTAAKPRVRRMIVVKVAQGTQGTCFAVAVRTYGGTGISGLTDSLMEAHAILHVQDNTPVKLANEPRIDKRPIACRLASPARTIDAASRIDFSITRRVHCSWPVRLVAKVDRPSRPYFNTYYRQYLLDEKGVCDWQLE